MGTMVNEPRPAQTFSALLEQSRKITQMIERPSFVIQRNVEQIEEEARRLLQSAQHARHHTSTFTSSSSTALAPHYTAKSYDVVERTTTTATRRRGETLERKKSYDVQKLEKSLRALDVKSSFQPLEPLEDLDVAGFLTYVLRSVLVHRLAL